MRNTDLPSHKDFLFIPDKKDGDWLPTGADNFFKLSEGYRMTAQNIYEKIKELELFYKPFMANAMIFCFRQFIELRLKELHYFGAKFSGIKEDFQKTHDLIALFDDFEKEIIPCLNPNYDKKLFQAVRKLIIEFNSLDPQSMSFRYPVDKELNPSHALSNFDIDNFKDVMDKLSNFFDIWRQEIDIIESYHEELEKEFLSSLW